MTTLTDDFACEVLSVVAEIPEGCVATYGQIARLVGKEKNARLVAKILSRAEYYGHFPCHRIVNHAGRLAPHWPEQAFLLFREGVDLKPDGYAIRRWSAPDDRCERSPATVETSPPPRPSCWSASFFCRMQANFP